MQSPWEGGPFETGSASIGAPAHLAVIGAGIVGLFTALHYKRRHPGHEVLVLERGTGPSGASVKNAGFACFGSPSELLHDIDAEGEAAALARVEERWRGLRELRAELTDATIEFEPTGGHELYGVNDPLYTRVAERFDRLNDLLRPITGPRTYIWGDDLIRSLGLAGVAHLARTDKEGPIHTGRMIRALWTKVSEAGVALRTNASVHAIEETSIGVTLHLKEGVKIDAARAIIATNGYASELQPQLDIRPARGQVLLTSPLPDLKLRGTFHMNEGFYYFRDFEGRVLLGGGRHLDIAGETTTEDAVTDRIQQDLERLLREVILPGQSFTIEQRWSGIMGFREKGKTPFIDHVSPRVIAAVGLSGMGVAIGIRVARRAAELAAG